MDRMHQEVPSSFQKPGEIIRPISGQGTVEDILRTRYGLQMTHFQELNSYNDINNYVKVAPLQTHPRMKSINQNGYVLKIFNIKESQNIQSFEAHHAMMNCLREHKIPTQELMSNLDGGYFSAEVIYPDNKGEGSPRRHVVDLRTFIPGNIIRDVPYTAQLLIQDGKLIGNVSKALQNFSCPFYENNDPRRRLWSTTNVPVLLNYTFCLDEDKKQLVADVVSVFNRRVVTQFDELPKGHIQGDLNQKNILVRKDSTGSDYEICGILDFTEAEYSYPILDLALNSAYMMIDSDQVDQLDTPGYILSGYLSVRSLTSIEWNVLVPCMAGRLAQSLTLGAHAYHIVPENTYPLKNQAKGWPLLKRLWSTPEDELITRWKEIIESNSHT